MSAPYCDRCGRSLADSLTDGGQENRGQENRGHENRGHENRGHENRGHENCVRARELEPPRYCQVCRRRMVVQVTPTGWSASCVEHGSVASG